MLRYTLLLSMALVLAANAQPQGGQTPQTPPDQGKKGGRGGGSRTGMAPVEETGFISMFDGKSLQGWDCDPEFFRVEGGAIVGETTTKQPARNIFCIWRGGQPADFDLKLQYKLTGGNSGIQYRSNERPDIAKWVLNGYQADIDAAQRYTGMLYEEGQGRRGFINNRGLVTTYVAQSKRAGLIGSLEDGEALKTYIKPDDWNDLQVIARGSVLIHMINGHVTSMFIDDDKEGRRMSGLIGIQLHVTPGPMKIEVRNIRLKNL